MKRLLILLTMVTGAICCKAQNVDNSTVPALDLGMYLGKWYEVARFDHSFERGINFATAEYSLAKNGGIRVMNSGIKEGKVKISEGKAKLTDTEGLLRVSFFGPFYSDYRVMMVTRDYKYALVGSKSPKYLWILSRTPDVPKNVMQLILTEARARGYNTNKLIWVNHNPDTILSKQQNNDHQ